ncbi:MAG: response regulator [Pseudomonadota bacterium]
MPRLLNFCLLCCLALIGVTARAEIAPAFVLEDAANRLEIAPWLDRLPSQFSALSSAQLLTQADDLPWQALAQPVLAQGYLRDGIWLRLKTRNDGLAQRRIIEFTRANLSHIEIMTRQSNGSWMSRHAGTAELSRRGDTNGLGYSFNLAVPEGHSITYLHLQSAYPLATPIRLSTENELLRTLQDNAGLFGAGIGLLGGMILGMAGLRSARLSLSVRWTFVSIVAMVIVQAFADRGVFSYWWLDLPSSLHSLIQLSICMLCIMHVLLCWQFLAQKQVINTRVRVLLRAVILANLLWMLIAVAWLPNPWSPLAGVLHWAGYIAIIVSVWRPAQQELMGARLYRGIMMTGLASQIFIDAALHGYLPFMAEPYQIMMLWHLLSLPVLLHVLEQPAAQQPFAAKPFMTNAATSTHKSRLITPTARSTMPNLPVVTRVLIVEDNPWVQQVLAGLLLKLNCQTALAADGRDALQRLKSEVFDLVLMDCDLPELDGFSTTQLWRAQALQQTGASKLEVPIIAITAHISASHRLQAEEAGMDDFLQKPIDMRALHDVLTRWLPHYSANA